MGIRIALAGNPNCGKTTMFNDLTGSNQYVGNWPGVTVEKKEGTCTRDKSITITDLPGVYSLSPYSPEEIVTRDFLLDGGPNVVINLVDATNLERNLYLTTQILDLGLPVVVALNMMDLVEKSGDTINVAKLSQRLGCPVVETSALKGRGMEELLAVAVNAAKTATPPTPNLPFDAAVEDALSQVSDVLGTRVKPHTARWFALKALEGEERTLDALNLPAGDREAIAAIREALENRLDDDAESIITGERYDAIGHVVDACVKRSLKGATATQKIDRVVTNRWLGIPIFIVVMTLVYYLAVSTVGTLFTDWANDGVFGDGWLYTGTEQYDEAVATWEETVAAAEEAGASEAELAVLAEEEPDPATFGVYIPGLTPVATEALESIGTAPWLVSLIVDGIIAGVGAVLGFVPQMIVLFLLLSLLEACGYMARVAFIMDRIFRKFGLSGKSFIPMLIASGCGVPAVMATKTIENEKDRRMTIITTTMIPCGAKMPIIALVFGAVAGGDAGATWWIAPLFYFLGVAAIIISGIMLRKTKMFAGEATPFIMELPAYHVPAAKNVLMATWERVRSFIVKAGTIIFLSSIVIWFLQGFGFYDGQFGLLDPEMEGYMDYSLMAGLGNALAWLFAPLGFGNWESAVTSITGLVAKENVVATVGVLTAAGDVGEADPTLWAAFGTMLGGSVPAILAFCAFNLLCAPCFAAIGTIRRQMASAKWTWFAIGYMTLFAWAVALMIYQFGLLLAGGAFTVWSGVAVVVLAGMLFQLLRPMPRFDGESAVKKLDAKSSAAA
ncbi:MULTISPECIES: ferrous iron transporter B [Gordonibacter]|uniref:Ferrous iron transporter B n=1 Tax=Gordonibacter faecis TaxID=3047475 RepID=A0ABT7DKU9_9ACTN|nr:MULTISPECIES: ferrous iron transporter B [unclassified Gordonibacter]MDJ1650156.1 ferrous iron transporter B [Gordonibacter sp. KGMB12511]HIW76331.1 ferrous iron transporter B [Candidatus Gordonibacter avicola]